MSLSRLQFLPLAVLLCSLASFAFAPSPAAAQDITMVKDAPGSVLYGDQSQVTLRVSNPDGQPTGYNLTIRDVLPAGVSYVADPLAPIAPTIIPNEPETGETTLIFDNVSDLSENSNYELTYRVSHDTDVFSIGDSYTNDAFAYISADARFEPEINPDGTPGDEHIDGSASASATTTISAIEIVKSEPSSEGEILRGAHDHQTAYTLTVRNNSEGPTDSVRVEDWLPAGLEFLGCGTGDNTTDAPTNPVPGPDEYAGSGPLNPGNSPAVSGCVDPDTVETVVTDPDGDGPLTSGVYTHVVWNDVADLIVDGEVVLRYVAAIPLRANTMTWSSGLPPATDGAQGSNLDNNSGAETFDEQELRNYALATGSYEGSLPVTDDHTLLRYAEDLAIHKSVDKDTILHGQVSEWTLHVRSSEYRYTDDVAITDTLPDGLCPLGSDNYENDFQEEAAECGPGGPMPVPDYSEPPTEQTDGTYTIVWDERTVPQFAGMQPSTAVTITFPTKTRDDYQHDYIDGTPILAEDFWENQVSIEGSAARICAPDDPECDSGGVKVSGDDPDPRNVTDVSSAGQRAAGIHIDKKVMENPGTFVDCGTGTYVDGPASGYAPGDTVCWQLRIDFPELLDTGSPTITDFLPPGVSYVPESAQPVAGVNDATGFVLNDDEAGNGVLTWERNDDVPAGGEVFAWRFETTVGLAVADRPGEVEGNLLKVSYPNTDDQSFPMRDHADIERSQALLELVKGVDHVNAGAVNPPDTDGVDVAAGDVVTFRVDVANTGDLAASNAVVWDDLQDGITCADVEPTSISDGGLCSDGRIVWMGLGVAAAGTHKLTYEVEIPAGVEPARTFNDHAGVVSYESATNSGTPFEYVPDDNISGASDPNAPAADDVSHVQTRDVTMAKTRETSVTESPGNNLLSEATIGEEIDYKTSIVVPEGTTLYGTPTFTDVLGTHQLLVTPPAVTVTRNGSPVDPGDFTLDTTGNTVSVEFLSPIVSPADGEDDTFEIAFTAQVADVAANHRGGTALRNTADFAWETQAGAAQTKSAHVDTTIVEPDVAVTKAATATASSSPIRPSTTQSRPRTGPAPTCPRPTTSWSSTTFPTA
jgi:large repetitive protein